jgi:superfamily II DNA/RNA helicase
MSFADLGVPAALTTVLDANGITTPFPIQSATLPDSLAGRDVLGRGRTGSGKTYAFVLPLLVRLSESRQPKVPGRPRALILAPTRELASQIDAALAPLAKAMRLSHMTIFGGVGANPQISGLRAGVDIVVACPGRLEDHMKAGHANLSNIEVTVLDEADHMADLGFLPSVRRILDKTPKGTQRLLFSATLDNGIDELVRRFLNNPVTHSVDSVASPVSTMDHRVLHLSSDSHRLPVIVELTSAPGRTVVFTRTKHRAKRLTRDLIASGVPAVELHGNLAQGARERNLSAFSSGAAETLVATDIAARGIHVDDVALVIHADPPVEHKAYLHRSGRTARAGNKGIVITLMTDDQVRDVRDLTRKASITPKTARVSPGDPLLAELAPGKRVLVEAPPAPAVAPGGQKNGGGRTRKPRPAAGSRQGHTGQGEAGRPARSASGGQRSSGGARSSAGARSDAPRQGGQRSSGGAPRTGGQGSAGGAQRSSGGTPARTGGAAAFSAGARSGRRSGR